MGTHKSIEHSNHALRYLNVLQLHTHNGETRNVYFPYSQDWNGDWSFCMFFVVFSIIFRGKTEVAIDAVKSVRLLRAKQLRLDKEESSYSPGIMRYHMAA